MKVLIAEDDEYLCAALKMALERRGYAVEAALSGSQAETALLTSRYDILLLDLGLPESTGEEILSRIRSRGDDTPIIIITAKDNLENKIEGLDRGANDYLVKPFHFGELEARMRAVLRKSHWQNKMEIQLGLVQLNTNNGSVSIKDQSIDLTPRETEVLKALMAKAGTVVSKRQLLEYLSSWEDESSENAIEIIIHRLRKKLSGSGVFINTVRGFGYLIEENKP